MSVFVTHAPRRPRPAVVLGLAALFIAIGAIVLANPEQGSRTATQLDALSTVVAEPQGTTFPEPSPIEWEGRILRTLAGGQGAELQSVTAPGGYFFAYFDSGFTASASEGPILVEGLWLGTSCEYGRCAPEVEVTSWGPLPIELE